MNNKILLKNEALKLWNENKGIELGRLVFNEISINQQPVWAGKILTLVYGTSDLKHETIEELLDIINFPEKWKNGKIIFSKIRRSVLDFDKKQERKHTLSEEEIAICGMLILAEQVAKVTYNATSPFDEFDEDSGHWIPYLLRDFTKTTPWDSESFSQKAWEALINF